MTYCSETDVEREIQKPITANTNLTSTELATIIEETDAEIDSKLIHKYEVPITGSKALLIVKRIATLLVAGKVEDMYGFNKRRAADGETSERVNAKYAEGSKLLNNLIIGKTSLAFATNGANLSVANQKVASSYDDGVTHSDAVDFGTNNEEDRY